MNHREEVLKIRRERAAMDRKHAHEYEALDKVWVDPEGTAAGGAPFYMNAWHGHIVEAAAVSHQTHLYVYFPGLNCSAMDKIRAVPAGDLRYIS